MILQHWIATTSCPRKHVTLLLKLLKHYKPEADYDALPHTAEQLVWIDGSDVTRHDVFSSPSEEITSDLKNRNKLPEPKVFQCGGKYLHYGLEVGITGKSAGVLYKDATLLQYIPIYKEDPAFLPRCIRTKVVVMICLS